MMSDPYSALKKHYDETWEKNFRLHEEIRRLRVLLGECWEWLEYVAHGNNRWPRREGAPSGFELLTKLQEFKPEEEP